MPFGWKSLLAALSFVVAVAACAVLIIPERSAGGSADRPAKIRTVPRVALDAAEVTYQQAHDRAVWIDAVWRSEQVRLETEAAQARARAAEAAARARSRATSSPAVTGTCAAMKPPGFPDWIIQRESRGNPNALNPSGAFGCAQLMPSSGGSGSYAERWARLWADGRGICHWTPPNYCAG